MEQAQSASAQLARLLRRWWEEAGSPTGGTRPTQQALAARLGVDQTTLSRYLNPKHLSTAPLRVVETLHTQLRAPAAELEEARALFRAALRENGRQRSADGGHAPSATASAAGDDPPVPDALDVPDVPDELDGEHSPGRAGPHGPGATGRQRSPWLRPVLVTAAMVLAFTAGVVVNERLSARDREATAGGAAGAVSASEAPYQWPLLVMGEEDQFTRARALQHLLNAHGYKVRADGFFREDTREAVMDFQQRHDLPVDGKVGALTWPELVKVIGHESGTSEVRAAQELLNNVGQGGTAVSGRFTAATVQDLRFFQRTHRLAETGRVDVDTWLALLVEQRPPVRAPAYQRGASPLPSASV
ncbi:peptidoglycan-binding protein [Streptomyces sp. NPDC053792]|uniref:peptidoglycan-binding protein n=1 Tax=Streptomyces sp. NPDC053792 TaxID=3365716 RepID=UPI0037D00127